MDLNELLCKDFLWHVRILKHPAIVFLNDCQQAMLGQKWLEHLVEIRCTTVEEKRKRNKLMCKFVKCLDCGQLQEPFCRPPRQFTELATPPSSPRWHCNVDSDQYCVHSNLRILQKNFPPFSAYRNYLLGHNAPAAVKVPIVQESESTTTPITHTTESSSSMQAMGSPSSSLETCSSCARQAAYRDTANTVKVHLLNKAETINDSSIQDTSASLDSMHANTAGTNSALDKSTADPSQNTPQLTASELKAAENAKNTPPKVGFSKSLEDLEPLLTRTCLEYMKRNAMRHLAELRKGPLDADNAQLNLESIFDKAYEQFLLETCLLNWTKQEQEADTTKQHKECNVCSKQVRTALDGGDGGGDCIELQPSVVGNERDTTIKATKATTEHQVHDTPRGLPCKVDKREANESNSKYNTVKQEEEQSSKQSCIVLVKRQRSAARKEVRKPRETSTLERTHAYPKQKEHKNGSKRDKPRTGRLTESLGPERQTCGASNSKHLHYVQSTPKQSVICKPVKVDNQDGIRVPVMCKTSQFNGEAEQALSCSSLTGQVVFGDHIRAVSHTSFCLLHNRPVPDHGAQQDGANEQEVLDCQLPEKDELDNQPEQPCEAKATADPAPTKSSKVHKSRPSTSSSSKHTSKKPPRATAEHVEFPATQDQQLIHIVDTLLHDIVTEELGLAQPYTKGMLELELLAYALHLNSQVVLRTLSSEMKKNKMFRQFIMRQLKLDLKALRRKLQMNGE